MTSSQRKEAVEGRLQPPGTGRRANRRGAIGRALLLLASVALLPAPHAEAQRPDNPPIAAAADLQAALPEVAALFTRTTGRQVRLSFGSSGAFTQQILHGAPFQLFLSADEAYVERLARAGRTVDRGRLYAIGRIGLFLPHGSPIRADPSLHNLGRAAADGRLKKFAIANPAHAPYGRAAREALTHAGVWTAVEPKLVFGENAAQATLFATAGGAQGGIIPLSLALTPAVQEAGRFILIPADRHEPLRQRAVLLAGSGPTAEAFYLFLFKPPARAIFQRHGFRLPAEPG